MKDIHNTVPTDVFRPSTNVWWIRKSSDLSTVSTTFGSSGDIPITGNWDGDSYADIAVYRPSTGYWHVQRTTAGSMSLAWGTSSDIPVPADFDGDGKTDLAVYRPSTGAWWIMKSSTGFNGSYVTHSWGNYGDQPVPADYDGDGMADLAVWRPKTGVWYISKSSEDNAEYEYHSLGVAGNTAVPSAYLAQVGVSVPGLPMAEARLSPKNATGGTDLYSQNFGWGSGLVSLPGRSGLNAGFGISYNSLVWTKLGSEMHFDVDQSNVSPGFRLGFATIEAPYYNDTTEKFSFVMLSPSGSRIEFRQTAVSNLYETADSSYTQLKLKAAISVNTPVEDIEIEIRTTDGTMMTYEWHGGAYRCSQIKDRNGNYITIDHDEDGSLQKVTDTLGREIVVHYDSQLYPTSITQTWRTNNGDSTGTNVTHTWASFTYTTKTVATDFGSLAVVGPPNGTVIKVLEKVVYSDGSYTKFTHNGYIQVEKIENFAADNHVLNRTTTNLDSLSGSQSDCPRFTKTRSYVENFNGGQNVVVNNEPPVSDGYSLPGGLSGDAAKVVVHMDDHPHELYSQIYFGESGWKEGLTLATEDCTGDPEGDCTTRKRWTWTDWRQDNSHPTDPSTLPYILNPRVVESRVGDGTNTKRSTIEYWVNTGTNVAIFGLPMNQYVFDTDLSTVLKASSMTYYDPSSAYTSRRIIGLPAMVQSYGGPIDSSNLVSKVTYEYDEGDFSDSGLQQNISPTQHDGTNYGSSFITGRANLTSMTRWNAEYPTNSSYAITSSTKYNTAGSPVARLTPWDGTNTRITKIGYADSWNDSVGRTTFAYPTTMTDPANYSSTISYRYDTGANVLATSPAPAGQSYGKTTKRFFDNMGRLERESVFVNTTEKSYTRYEFPTNGTHKKSYTPLIDADSDGMLGEDEILSETWVDGAGRARLARSPHTFSEGEPATWVGTITEYDILGRVARQSVPTEIDGSWDATGDDEARDFVYNYQYYDWNNRVIRTVPSDSTGSDGKDTLIEYAGCGCAGGLVTTVKGPVSTAVDVSGTTQTTKRRVQKIHEDVLGRKNKIETWDLDGDGSAPYRTVKTVFDGRDKEVAVRDYQGGETSSTYLERTAVYDGHGRLTSSHRPEERDASNNASYTTYTYNQDDSIATMTDGRGVVTTYTYENVSGVPKRPLTTGIAWNVGSTGVSGRPGASFAYDPAGNRTSMTDGLGTISYSYNSLSQMTSETREFTALVDESYSVSYAYEPGGQLRTITDPNERVITYGYYKNGRLKAVNGSGFELTVPVVTEIKHRAWGAVKEMTYGNGVETSLTYDSKLRPLSYQVTNFNYETTLGATYSYGNDGYLESSTNLTNDKFDRAYTYDFAGRIKQALTGTEARGGTTADGPYKQVYSYDVWGSTTTLAHREWSGSTVTDNFSYSNNRRSGFSYNALGQVASTLDTSHSYDAAGARTKVESLLYATGTWGSLPAYEATTSYAGDSTPSKQTITTREDEGAETSETTYYVRSTVLGGKTIAELNSTGDWKSTPIYAEGMIVAWYSPSPSPNHPDNMWWQHPDPVSGNRLSSGLGAETGGVSHLDPLGNDVTYEPAGPIEFPEPRYIDPTSWWPLEISWGPSENFLEAYAAYEAMIGTVRGRNDAERAWRNGNRDLAIRIVSQDPNLGIKYFDTGLIGKPSAGTIFGAEAAAFLTRVDHALREGILVEADRGRGLGQSEIVGGDFTDGNIQGMMREAIRLAETLMINSNECVNVLTGNYAPRDTLSKVRINGRPTRNGPGRPWASGPKRAFAWLRSLASYGSIDLYNDFFTDAQMTFNGEKLSVIESRALTILHELGHVTGAYWHASEGGAPFSDGVTGILPKEDIGAAAVNQRIYDSCFKDRRRDGIRAPIGTVPRGSLLRN